MFWYISSVILACCAAIFYYMSSDIDSFLIFGLLGAAVPGIVHLLVKIFKHLFLPSNFEVLLTNASGDSIASEGSDSIQVEEAATLELNNTTKIQIEQAINLETESRQNNSGNKIEFREVVRKPARARSASKFSTSSPRKASASKTVARKTGASAAAMKARTKPTGASSASAAKTTAKASASKSRKPAASAKTSAAKSTSPAVASKYATAKSPTATTNARKATTKSPKSLGKRTSTRKKVSARKSQNYRESPVRLDAMAEESNENGSVEIQSSDQDRFQQRFFEVEWSGSLFDVGKKLTVGCALRIEKSETKVVDSKTVNADLNIPRVAFYISGIGFMTSPPATVDCELVAESDTLVAKFELEILPGDYHAFSVTAHQDETFLGEVVVNNFPMMGSEITKLVQSEPAKPLRPRYGENAPDLAVEFGNFGSVIKIRSPRECLSLNKWLDGGFRSKTTEISEIVGKALNSLYRSYVSLEELRTELLMIGELIRRILPEELVDYLQDERVNSIELRMEPDGDFPIELCRLERGETSFLLGERISVCRWYSGSCAVANGMTKYISQIAQVEGRLNNDFDAEAQVLRTLCPPAEIGVRATSKEQFEAGVLKSAAHDLIHFKGHMGHGDGPEKFLSFENGSNFKLLELPLDPKNRAFSKAEPVIVLNGCNAAMPVNFLGGTDSFPFRFALFNATAVIATLCKVDETVGSAFSSKFYESIKSEDTVEKAVFLARRHLFRSAMDDSNNLSQGQRIAHLIGSNAYVYFGPHNLRITFQ